MIGKNSFFLKEVNVPLKSFQVWMSRLEKSFEFFAIFIFAFIAYGKGGEVGSGSMYIVSD